jgi:hypothetical protein
VRRRPLTLIALLAALLTVAGPGCSGGGGKNGSEEGKAGSVATTTDAPLVTPPSVTVTATEYAFDLPAEIEGGVVRMTLQNNGKVKHEAVIVAAGDTPLARLKQDLTPIAKGQGKATPDYLRFRGGVSLVPGGTSAAATLSLPPGKYVMVCTLTDADSLEADKNPDGAAPPPAGAERLHFDLGMAVPFVVTKTDTAAIPATDGVVFARDWAFEVPPLAPGIKTLMFRNDGAQDHSLAVSEFPEGVDAGAAKAAFETLLAADADHPPPDGLPTPDDVAFAGPLSTSGWATFTVGLKPNRTYVFACYMSDRTGGPLHATGKGMVAYATTPAG